MAGRRQGPSGILVIDKAPGMTSFDVVARARRALGERHIGHAGTLDPAASGVLPLLVGEATKLMPYLVDGDKEYVATIRLGIATETHDLEGRILATAPVPPLHLERVGEACRRLVGRIAQTPPMYSAVHHEGRRLYELAREGVEVVRRPREVTVHRIDVLELGADSVTVRVVCGKGTYVRVLAADLGADLGCGGAVERLARVRVGPFTRDEALPAGSLATEDRRSLLARLRPLEAALASWPVVELADREARAFAHGQPVPLPGGPTEAPLMRVRDREGTFLGVGRGAAGGTRVRPERIVHADRPGARDLPA
jgi:tRNA pseudouridine55 synthase